MNARKIIKEAELEAREQFERIDEISLHNTEKVLKAFQNNRVSDRHLKGSSGYGYGDIGKETLCRVYADIFHAEDCIVSPLIANGTHALTIGLFSLLRTGDILYSITGAPYDTLEGVIKGEGGSLREYGIDYIETSLAENGDFNYEEIRKVLENNDRIKAVFITRSRGYSSRDAFSSERIGQAIGFVKSIKNVNIFVDNCYGEFTERVEPTDFGADLMAGSLIKNIGGGIAPTGGYLVGRKDLVEQASFRLTAPGLGNEVGSYISGYLPYYQGLFLAPHTVANALKGSVLAGFAFRKLGFSTIPSPEKPMYDIIRSIVFDTKEQLISFIQSIQKYSPIDSDVLPLPWDMPGYTDQVIMAAGTFVGGASIELSADAPIKEPYIAYLQGGLTYEHVKLALIGVIEELINKM